MRLSRVIHYELSSLNASSTLKATLKETLPHVLLWWTGCPGLIPTGLDGCGGNGALCCSGKCPVNTCKYTQQGRTAPALQRWLYSRIAYRPIMLHSTCAAQIPRVPALQLHVYGVGVCFQACSCRGGSATKPIIRLSPTDIEQPVRMPYTSINICCLVNTV